MFSAIAPGPELVAILCASCRAVSPKIDADKEDGSKTMASRSDVSHPSREPLAERDCMCGMG